ncbi:tetratricopeptide repeat protein [Aquimarina sp. 2201CG5-10]|uniref:tetratricopeptide repeat protein n=1 Tax=Aquimarina callyspongiae TaxID=3098150 RepID=UPI002AB5C8B3|nr:tetratricopeptide repeat protein [Aquimarina sp. 2201CG5-10]MDY8135568.1 tetratricopeptide repeat protein [Aquimarina sp. 2201CG5-10]
MRIKYCWIFLVLVVVSCGDLNKKMDLIEIDETFRAGDLEEARIDIKEYLKKTKDNEYAWTLLGHINSEMDKDSLAIVAYEKALKINQTTEEALTGLGILARKEGDYLKATEYYEKAIEINPKYAQAYSSLVTIYLKQKNFEKAVEVGVKGYRLDKSDPTIASNLSVAYHYFGDIQKRDEYYKIAEQNGYKNIEALKQIFDGELTVFD